MDWSYVAGFFDGEGNVHINKIFGKQGTIRSYQLVVRLYNSDLDLLNKIKDFMGVGSIYSAKKKDLSSVHELTISKKSEVKFVLYNLKEYCHGKKQKIDFILNNFNFDRDNNLSFDLNHFHSLTSRRNASAFYVDRPKHSG